MRSYQKVDSTANRDVVEYQLVMFWRHLSAFQKKINWIRDVYVITLEILKLNSWAFLMTSTILLLKLLMFSNNSLRTTVLSLWRSNDRKNCFVINEIWKLISIKGFIKNDVITKWCHDEVNQTYPSCAFIKFIIWVIFV